jgi:hypothetical protein
VIAGDRDLMAHATGTGFAFTTATGAALDSEVVAADPASGALEAWVRLPTLAPGVNTIVLEYGGPNPATSAAATWSRFAGVWHMTGTRRESDRTDRGSDLEPTDTNPAFVPGIIGDSRSFNGTTDQLCGPAPVPGTDPLSFDTASFAYSVWVNVTANVDDYDQVLYKGGASAGDPGYDLELGAFNWAASISDGAATTQMGLTVPTGPSWVHLATVIDREQGIAFSYTNGVASDSTSLLGVGGIASALPICVSGHHPFNGAIDELRILNIAPPAAWFATEYANVIDRAGFLEIGAEMSTSP